MCSYFIHKPYSVSKQIEVHYVPFPGEKVIFVINIYNLHICIYVYCFNNVFNVQTSACRLGRLSIASKHTSHNICCFSFYIFVSVRAPCANLCNGLLCLQHFKCFFFVWVLVVFRFMCESVNIRYEVCWMLSYSIDFCAKRNATAPPLDHTCSPLLCWCDAQTGGYLVRFVLV